jgi:hypothetical protein
MGVAFIVRGPKAVMRILSVLPQSSLRVLSAVLGQRHAIQPVAVEHLVAGNGPLDHDLLVIDPEAIPERLYRATLEALQRRPIAVGLYADLSPSSCRRALDASTCGFAELVLRNFYRTQRALECRLEAAAVGSAGAALLRRVAGRIRMVPPDLRLHLTAMFGGAPTQGPVSELAAAAVMPRRTVDRWVSRVGISSALDLMRGIGVAASFLPLSRVWPLGDVDVETTGYASARSGNTAYHKFLNMTVRQAAKRLTAEEVGARIATKLVVRGVSSML